MNCMYFQEVVAFILVKQNEFLAERRKQTKKVLPGALVIPVGKIEAGEQKRIIIRPDETCPAEHYNVICFDDHDGVVKI